MLTEEANYDTWESCSYLAPHSGTDRQHLE